MFQIRFQMLFHFIEILRLDCDQYLLLYFRNKFSEIENFDIKFLLVQNTFSKNNLNPKNELFGSSEMLGQIKCNYR